MRTIGEMLEWLKRHAWKACGLLKGLASSNLALSANLTALQIVPQSRFCIMFMSSHFDRLSDRFIPYP